MHTSDHIPNQSPVDEIQLTPELVMAVLSELDRDSSDDNTAHLKTGGFSLIAGQLARRLASVPRAEVLAFFKAQSVAMVAEPRLVAPEVWLNIARIRGIRDGFDTDLIDVLDSAVLDDAFKALDQVAKERRPHIAARVEKLVAELAGWVAYERRAPRGGLDAEALVEQAARDIALAMGDRAEHFVDALRAFVKQSEQARA